MRNRDLRKELRKLCGKHCGKSRCLDLCKTYDWFACEYHKDSGNCVAVVGTVHLHSTIIPGPNEEHGLCYLNHNKTKF